MLFSLVLNSLCCPGWLWTRSRPPASTSYMLRLQVCTSMPTFDSHFYFLGLTCFFMSMVCPFISVQLLLLLLVYLNDYTCKTVYYCIKWSMKYCHVLILLNKGFSLFFTSSPGYSCLGLRELLWFFFSQLFI